MEISILVVTRSNNTIEIVKEAVSPWECQVIYANSIALALFLARKNFPSLIIADKELIDGSGQELASEIGSDLDLANMPIILISPDNYSLKDLRQKVEPYLIPIKDERKPETSE